MSSEVHALYNHYNLKITAFLQNHPYGVGNILEHIYMFVAQQLQKITNRLLMG